MNQSINYNVGFPKQSSLFVQVAGLLVGAVSLAGLLANAFVVVAVLGESRMRSSAMNLLLLNLAITDFFYLLSHSAIWAPIAITGQHAWIGPLFMCPIDRYFNHSFILISILTYLAISVERYLAIVHPIHAKSLCQRTRIIATIVFIWIFALISQTPIYLMFQGVVHLGEYEFDERMCTNPHFPPFYLASWIWLWSNFLVHYIIPAAVSTVLYFKICRVLWFSTVLHSNGSSTSNTSSSLVNGSVTRLESRRNVIKMLIICVLLFYFCYTPMAMFLMCGALFHVRMEVPLELAFVVFSLVQCSSALNPFLYTLFSKSFRDRLFNICRWRSSRRTSTDTNLINYNARVL